MTLADAERVAVLLAALMLIGAFVAAAVVTVRVRRRWRARRRGPLAFLRQPTALIPASRITGTLAETVGSPSWWLVQRDRHAMWRSIAAAHRAVSVAARADAPVGDLPMLMRQLQRAARSVDAALRASGSTRDLSPQIASERARIQEAAASIRASAVEALEVTSYDAKPVVSAVAVEISALAEGARAARF